MKKPIIVLLLVFIMLQMASCGEKEAPEVNMPDLYEKILSYDGTPEMVVVPPDKAELLFGISAESCAQEITAICQDSLRADEFWLIEAKDAAAAEQIEALAKARAEQKASELKDYLPDQYQVVQKARIIRKGKNIAMIVSPISDELAKLF